MAEEVFAICYLFPIILLIGSKGAVTEVAIGSRLPFFCYYVSFSECWLQQSYKIFRDRIVFVLLRSLGDKMLLYIYENK